MTASEQIARQFREVVFGGNWTAVNIKDTLNGVTWQQAVTRVQSFNTIAMLVYHMGYYVSAATRVLEGGALEAHDKFSFDVPEIASEEDWKNLVLKFNNEAEKFASLVERVPDQKLQEDFSGEKYGSYLRNICGIIEHHHYHLGQIVLLKKMIR